MRIKTIIVLLCVVLVASAADKFVTFKEQGGAVSLQGATIGYGDNEPKAVQIAAANLQQDVSRVMGFTPVLSPLTSYPSPLIMIGTVGCNKQVDQWVKNGQLPNLKGCREKFIITTINGQVVIAGSDRRGTVYGIYELSRQMGVSPWYWWMDVPVAHRDYVGILPGSYTDGEPAVEFRGLFLNDEAPCLTSWVKNTFGTNYGDHRFYAKVFELILRLKGNLLWPAMWGWAFYADDPENSKTADEMGIIMGTSHHEPMARNHQEYARKRGEWGPWNYQKNQQNLDRFFREGIERMKGTEDMVTIGMRGDGDEAMSAEADTKLLQRIVENQRKIIKQVTKKPAEKTTQVWALYKEVLDYYDAGMRVPDDVIMLLCDDNWGNIRRVPPHTANRALASHSSPLSSHSSPLTAHKGGWGLYYHVDYVGAPRNTKWLNVTQTQQMFEQLSLAYDFGIQRMWILNVGDLKPMEYPIQLFMDMAWNPKEYTQQTVTDHTRAFFRTVLSGPATVPDGSPSGIVAEAASIYNRNCQYMARVTPEMLDANTYNLQTGEWRQVADDYARLELRALRLYQQVPVEARDAFRQSVLFPVQAMANLYDMYYAQAMNHHLASIGSPDANLWAARVKECFLRDSLLCLDYNKVMAGGKWDGMMTQKHIGYTSWNDDFPHEMLPQTAIAPTPVPSSVPTSAPSSVPTSAPSSVPTSAPSSASTPAPSSASTPAPSSASTPAPSSATTPAASAAGLGGYTFSPSAGFIAIEAEHYYSSEAPEGTCWSVYPDYGRTRSAVALTPYTKPADGALLTYRFSLPAVRFSPLTSSPSPLTSVTVHIVVKSTLDFLNVGGHEYTVSLDGSEPQAINFNKTLLDKQPYMYSEFYPAVARRVVEKTVTLPVSGKDIHELTLSPRHPGIVFEKIVIDFGGYQPQYLFGAESPYQRR